MSLDESSTEEDCILTIAIPTYNRAEKVKRLLSAVKEEIVSSKLQEQVAVIVSNNASTDETHTAVSGFDKSGLKLEYHRQPENLGFDGNLRFLYTKASTKYVWFMADDDLPLKGAIVKIVKAIETTDPDVLLFSFIQPPGSTVKTFDFPETVHLVTETVSAIESVLCWRKLSIYVLRKCSFSDCQWRVLDENLGDGWCFVSLAFSVLESSSNLKLAIISEPLATCDEDFMRLPWTPEPFLCMDKMVQHPLVSKNSPGLIKQYREKGYLAAIQFSFAAKVGSLLPESPEGYNLFIKQLEWRIFVLLKAPRSLFQLIALKLRVTWLWPKIRFILAKVRN